MKHKTVDLNTRFVSFYIKNDLFVFENLFEYCSYLIHTHTHTQIKQLIIEITLSSTE